MILKEFEGKELLSSVGLAVPKSILVSKDAVKQQLEQAVKQLNFPVYVKAQVLYGNRELTGLIKTAKNKQELEQVISEIFSKKDKFQQSITECLVEESIKFEKAVYVSLSYSTESRSLVVSYSEEAGAGMDDRGESIRSVSVPIREEIVNFPFSPELVSVLNKLKELFIAQDAKLIEINPLVQSGKTFTCLDAKIELDNLARFRHPEWEKYGERTQSGRPATQIELRAKEISNTDTRGVAGESFFEFPGGEIGVLASGGGASTLAMDALLIEGLKPANYTEYSGNPTKEKVAALTELVLSLDGLKALYVVGSNANFTDIYETLSGVISAVLEAESLPKNFAILIRRGGPRWKEAFKMVEEKLAGTGIRYKLFGPGTPIVQTAEELKEMLCQS